MLRCPGLAHEGPHAKFTRMATRPVCNLEPKSGDLIPSFGTKLSMISVTVSMMILPLVGIPSRAFTGRFRTCSIWPASALMLPIGTVGRNLTPEPQCPRRPGEEHVGRIPYDHSFQPGGATPLVHTRERPEPPAPISNIRTDG